ncbi:ribonuclease R [Pseudochelatococcus lubricantis]|uniref:ribonuclease R n=1 Tax=Pseudochelatococcus lubricantis TaxID=1538102 RepID=UPI001FE5E13F|nr:ribonuclease R [Pseudochelatococcus lubricantis]
MPTKEQIVSFITESPGKVGKREIARAFGIGGGQRIWLKRILRELEDEGAIDRRHKTLNRTGSLPPVVLADITARDRDGELIARPAEWDDADGDARAPRILVHLPRRQRPGQPVPGVGDRVLLRIEANRDRDSEETPSATVAYVGRVIKVLAKVRAQVLGIFRANPDGPGGRLVPVDKKLLGREMPIRPGDAGDAQDGDLVSVSVARAGRFGSSFAKVSERLGSLKSERAVSLIAIRAHDIPDVFSPAALREAEEAQPAPLAGREDWRTLPLVTIDPADAKDHDDAVHATPDSDPANAGGFIVTVAIADVAAYVRPGTALDRDALERGNSVYFPDRVVPMLPERISNDLGSLRPREDRAALAVRMVIDVRGRKRHHTFHRIMMRSAAKLAYPQAQAAIDGAPDDTTGPILDSVLRPLWDAYAAMTDARDERDPLALDLPERKLILKPDGTLDRVVMPERLDAHRLIEECMILANVCAAETLEQAGSPLIYRTHDEPSPEKLRALAEVLASIGIKAPKTGALSPTLFNRILAHVEGSPNRDFVNEVVLRTQAQAEYSADNYGHFGLNLRRYAHFTSPIRRYADLVVHRGLIRALKLGKDGLPAHASREELAEVAAQISAAERRAMAAERETTDRLIAHFMADQIGATFAGRIAGVTGAGLFVKLDDTGADGFIPASTLGQDYFRFDETLHALVGSRSRKTYRLGDRVEVRLVEAVPIAGALRFELLGGDAGRTPRRGSRIRRAGIDEAPARGATTTGGRKRRP